MDVVSVLRVTPKGRLSYHPNLNDLTLCELNLLTSPPKLTSSPASFHSLPTSGSVHKPPTPESHSSAHTSFTSPNNTYAAASLTLVGDATNSNNLQERSSPLARPGPFIGRSSENGFTSNNESENNSGNDSLHRRHIDDGRHLRSSAGEFIDNKSDNCNKPNCDQSSKQSRRNYDKARVRRVSIDLENYCNESVSSPALNGTQRKVIINDFQEFAPLQVTAFGDGKRGIKIHDDNERLTLKNSCALTDANKQGNRDNKRTVIIRDDNTRLTLKNGCALTDAKKRGNDNHRTGSVKVSFDTGLSADFEITQSFQGMPRDRGDMCFHEDNIQSCLAHRKTRSHTLNKKQHDANHSDRPNNLPFRASSSVTQIILNSADVLIAQRREAEQEIVRHATSKKEQEFEQCSMAHRKELDVKWLERQRLLEKHQMERLERDKSAELEVSKEVGRSMTKMSERHARHAKSLSDKMVQGIAEHERYCRELTYKTERQITMFTDQLTDILASCRYLHRLSDKTRSCQNIINEIGSKVASLVTGVVESNQPLNEGEKGKITDLFTQAKKIIDIVRASVEKANTEGAALQAELEAAAARTKAAEEEAKASAVAASTAAASAAAVSAAVAATAPANATYQSLSSSSTLTTGVGQAAADTDNLSSQNSDQLYSNASSAHLYYSLQAKLEQAERQVSQFTSDPIGKGLRFELHRLINLPVNAISATSGAHLRDKLQRLTSIFSGQSQINETTGKRLSTNDHSGALMFCKELFARRIVLQASEQVSRNHEQAFPFAVVILGIWVEYPDVGKLFLAHLFKKCPYAVPFYVHKEESETLEEYCRRLGYFVSEDGKIEEQDKYLTRMAGFIRLYAALMVSSPPPTTHADGRGLFGRGANSSAATGTVHPYGLSNCWAWLANISNTEPRQDVTASCLHALLQVAGHSLHQTYGRQFIKMIQYLRNEYLTRIIAVTTGGELSGPVSRLTGFLEDILQRRGRIEQPKGLITPSFWLSR